MSCEKKARNCDSGVFIAGFNREFELWLTATKG